VDITTSQHGTKKIKTDNKTKWTIWTSLLKTRGNSRDTDNIGNMTQNQDKANTQHKKLKRWATWTTLSYRGWTQAHTNGKQFLLLIRHP